MHKSVYLTVPYPPSVNSYWGFNGSRRFLTPKAVKFKEIVKAVVARHGIKSLGSARLYVKVKLYPDSTRIADIDNRLKSLLDALCQAGVYDDDSQIDKLFVERAEVIKYGKTEVLINILN
jgi:crossover junction endodeoxyribonuclease RusA